MNQIYQYYKITNVKPDYYKLVSPYYNASKKRIIFNGKEVELHYSTEFKIYTEDQSKKIGSSELNVLCINF